MRGKLKKPWFILKALFELGPGPVVLNAMYRIGLRSGWLKFRTEAELKKIQSIYPGRLSSDLVTIPDKVNLKSFYASQQIASIMEEADLVCSGQILIFGDERVPVLPEQAKPLENWTAYRENIDSDIKFVWEPARFGWVYRLFQAYLLSGDEKYITAFWKLTDQFFAANPAYNGPQWVSGQEVAIRLLNLVFVNQFLGDSLNPSEEKAQSLALWAAIHAARIPPTLFYARSQNNNHLLAEAAGLFTAGLALPNHPESRKWLQTGWGWLEKGIASQIQAGGAYTQHSTNYHRLMIQIIYWVTILGHSKGFTWKDTTLQRIHASLSWLAALVDPTSGQVPNLGPNDSAYLMPLSECGHHDFRPVLQAAWNLFFGKTLYPAGPWDDLGYWMNPKSITISNPETRVTTNPNTLSKPITIRHPGFDSWCYLRAEKIKQRPGHADQLHLDIWWRGINLALDPGTYRYNAPPPWDNSLTHTSVHNTLVLDQHEQMTRVSRFLYLDWAQAYPVYPNHGGPDQIYAEHTGYRKIGCIHQRSTTIVSYGWKVTDRIIPSNTQSLQNKNQIDTQLHWLLPDWPFELPPPSRPDQVVLRLKSPYGWVEIKINSDQPGGTFAVVRAGILLDGQSAALPIQGWQSPNYGQLFPALSFSFRLSAGIPLNLITEWHLPQGGS